MGLQLSDEEALDVEMLRSGGEQARVDFFERHRNQLTKLAQFRMDPRVKRRVSDSDIIQEVFIKYVDEIDPYLDEVGMPPKVWLRRLVRRVIYRANRDHIQTQGRDLRREHPLDTLSSEGIRELVESLSSVGEKIDRQQLREKIRDIVSRMPKLDREILSLVHFEEQSILEASMELGIKYEAAKKRYRRSLNRLKEIHETTLKNHMH